MSNVKLENVRLLDPVAQIDVTTTVYLQNGRVSIRLIRSMSRLMLRANG